MTEEQTKLEDYITTSYEGFGFISDDALELTDDFLAQIVRDYEDLEEAVTIAAANATAFLAGEEHGNQIVHLIVDAWFAMNMLERA